MSEFKTIEINNIRNICVIAHPDAGKTSLTDCLMGLGGFIKSDDIGAKRITDTRQDEEARGITIKSTGINLNLTYMEQSYSLNLIDCPGHIDFNQNTQASIRLVDGALVLVDVVSGVETQTITVLRQALTDRLRPILVINKFDRLLFELKLNAKEAHSRICKILFQLNQIIDEYQIESDKWLNKKISPDNLNVVFTSAYHNWGFDLQTFAELYVKINPTLSVEKLIHNMWSDADTFCKAIYKPIKQIADSIINSDLKKLELELQKFGFKLSPAELEQIESKTELKILYKTIFKKLFPLGQLMRRAIVEQLPSPLFAQTYRASVLYSGPNKLSDEIDNDMEASSIVVYESIKMSNVEGPLIFFASLMIPTDGDRFLAFGRIFSGTINVGQKINIFNAGYEYKSNSDRIESKTINKIIRMNGIKPEAVQSASVGQIVALGGIDQYMTKSGTISNLDHIWPIRTIKFGVSPIVQRSIRPKSMADLPKMIEGMKKLSKSDPVVKCTTSEAGESIIAGTGDLHLEICIEDLKSFAKIELIIGDPIIQFRESIKNSTGKQCLAKSANKHNRIWLSAEPLDPKLVLDLESKRLTLRDKPNLIKALTTEYGWDQVHARKIWAIGPEFEPTNIIVDCTIGTQYMQEIMGSIVAGFQHATIEGPLSEEPIRGIRFNIVDVTLHADAIHRGMGQLMPTIQRAMYACILSNQPILLEPIFTVYIQTISSEIGTVYGCLNNRRGTVEQIESSETNPTVTIIGKMPVAESFGFDSFLKSETSGKALAQLIFNHWEKVPDAKYIEFVEITRKRKNLPKEIPLLERFEDKL